MPDTSATYAGQPGHAYAFSSLAVDNVGHRQTTPSTPVETQVVAHVWHNCAKPCDVDGKDGVQPQDVLSIINWINAHPGVTTPPAPPAAGPPYYDVDADDLILPQDVLLVVNYINSHPTGSGEGEASLGLVLTPLASPAADGSIGPSGRAATAGRDPSAAASAGQSSSAVLWESQAARPPVREAAAGSRSSPAQRRVRVDQVWDDWDAGLDPLDAILLDLAPGVRLPPAIRP